MQRLHRALLAASCLGLLAVPALAWEWNYGPPNTLEDGYRRVHPVPSCGQPFPKNGYIAIGTQDIGGPNPEVYVVYTDITGAIGWEATYDVEGLGLTDEGMAIASIKDKGYVFLSNSLNGVWRPALTFIDCKGNVLWSQIYPDALAGQNLWGNDLIVTQSGNPAWRTAAGDYAVAGWWFNGGNEDAFLMRTDAAGNLIWNAAYNNQGLNEAFNGLTEALPVPAGQTADLVAVGRLNTGGNLQGLVARASGDNGAIGAFPQCMQHHGNAGSGEYYNSVTSLQVQFPGQFAFVGSTRGADWIEDIWVTRGNTCPLLAQARVGNPVGTAPTLEQGNDIIEVRVPKPGTPLGSLAIAGMHLPPGGLPKAALTVLNAGVLAPLGGLSWLFAAPLQSSEYFYSLAEDPNGWSIPPGYVFAGLTQANAAGADPQDLYLVHDDNPAVPALCEKQWNPVRVPLNWPQVNLQPGRRDPARHIPVPTPYWYQDTGKNTCP